VKVVDPASAVAALEDGTRVVFPGGCADPRRFYQAFSADVERFSSLTVCSGLSLGRYDFLQRGLGEHFHYTTWQAAPALRKLFRENDRAKVSFVPLRLSDLMQTIRRDGLFHIDAQVIQTSMPQADGTVSLGISVGPNPHFLQQTRLVIAEMNSNMPVTAGNSRVPLERIDFAIESDEPLATYDTGSPDARDERIIENVLSLIPDRATVQLGIGAVPDRVLASLGGVPGVSLYSGMLSQGLVTFLDTVAGQPQILTGELAGLPSLYERCNGNTLVNMQGLDYTHHPGALAELDRFISINSAIEIDLMGQSNGETLGATQISGAGGSLEYIEAAARSPGGCSIIAMPSTTADGKRSKIVAALAPGSVVTTPRFCVDCVVTEYGIARLRGRSLWQRAEALIAVSHPEFRDELAASVGVSTG
jgi:4-hydroxybutyrate CoA-transferase